MYSEAFGGSVGQRVVVIYEMTSDKFLIKFVHWFQEWSRWASKSLKEAELWPNWLQTHNRASEMDIILTQLTHSQGRDTSEHQVQKQGSSSTWTLHTLPWACGRWEWARCHSDGIVLNTPDRRCWHDSPWFQYVNIGEGTRGMTCKQCM